MKRGLRRDKIVLVLMIMAIVIAFIYFLFLDSKVGDNGLYNVTESEITILNGQHELLATAGEVVEDPSIYNFAITLEARGDWKEEYKIPNHRSYSMLRNKKQLNTIIADYIIDNASDGSGTIKLIILQGDKNASIRLQNTTEWYQVLSIPVNGNSTSIIPLEIQWDRSGIEELTLIPVPDGNLPTQSYVTPSRFPVVEHEIQVTTAMIDEQGFSIKEIDEENIGKYLLDPVLLDENGDEVKYKNDKTEKAIYSNKPFHYIFLNDVPYNTTIDVLYFDESGVVINLVKGVNIQAYRTTKISLTETDFKHTYNGVGRKFLLFVNNRGQEILADIQAAVNNVKPFITTITKVIEIHPTKNE